MNQSNSADQALKWQITKSALSVAANLAEGTGRSTRADKKHFYTIARGSIYETVSFLEIAKDMEWVLLADYLLLEDEYNDIARMLHKLIQSLDRS